MSTFEVMPRRVTVLPHPDPEVHSLALGQVDGYVSVIGKHSLTSGDLAVYIPEQAVVPDKLLVEMDLVGRLAGRDKNRVKALKLRGVLSQGLLYRPAEWPAHWVEGVDVAAELGITKWVPEIPTHMRGELCLPPDGAFFRSYTDIEPIEKFPDMFTAGEPVRFSEKLHGTCCIVGLMNGQRVVSSKGVASKHLAIQEDPTNLYWRVATEQGLFEKLERHVAASIELGTASQPNDILLFGEILGVQDLTYGYTDKRSGYRAFDVFSEAGYLDTAAFDSFTQQHAIPTVPVLYEGPYSVETMQEVASGQSTLAAHLREGIVIKPLVEQDYEGSRKIAKKVSPAYLLRKGEVTEFE